MYITSQLRQCEIRPVDNVYVKTSWSMTNFQNFVYNVQQRSMIPQNLVSHTVKRVQFLLGLWVLKFIYLKVQ